MCVVRCYTKMNQNIQSHNNSSLREEIAKRLWQIYIRDEYGITEVRDSYEYEYGVHDWRTYTERDKRGYLEDADDILKMVEKTIDTMWNRTNYAIDGDGFYQDIKKEILK
jgi:hypothetical protein